MEFWWKALEDTVIPIDNNDWKANPKGVFQYGQPNART